MKTETLTKLHNNRKNKTKKAVEPKKELTILTAIEDFINISLKNKGVIKNNPYTKSWEINMHDVPIKDVIDANKVYEKRGASLFSFTHDGVALECDVSLTLQDNSYDARVYQVLKLHFSEYLPSDDENYHHRYRFSMCIFSEELVSVKDNE